MILVGPFQLRVFYGSKATSFHLLLCYDRVSVELESRNALGFRELLFVSEVSGTEEGARPHIGVRIFLLFLSVSSCCQEWNHTTVWIASDQGHVLLDLIAPTWC